MHTRRTVFMDSPPGTRCVADMLVAAIEPLWRGATDEQGEGVAAIPAIPKTDPSSPKREQSCSQPSCSQPSCSQAGGVNPKRDQRETGRGSGCIGLELSGVRQGQGGQARPGQDPRLPRPSTPNKQREPSCPNQGPRRAHQGSSCPHPEPSRPNSDPSCPGHGLLSSGRVPGHAIGCVHAGASGVHTGSSGVPGHDPGCSSEAPSCPGQGWGPWSTASKPADGILEGGNGTSVYTGTSGGGAVHTGASDGGGVHNSGGEGGGGDGEGVGCDGSGGGGGCGSCSGGSGRQSDRSCGGGSGGKGGSKVLLPYMLSTRGDENNTVLYSSLACFVDTFTLNMNVSMSYTELTRRNTLFIFL